MKVARKILMTIAAILYIIFFIGLAICDVAFFISINNEEMLQRILDGLNRSTMSLEEGKTLATGFGVIFAIVASLGLINAILSIRGIKSHKTSLMVLNIVFGILAGVYVNSLGGLFGLFEE